MSWIDKKLEEMEFELRAGFLIKQLRLSAFKHVDELAADIGITPKALTEIERGKAPLTSDLLSKIKTALSPSASDIKRLHDAAALHRTLVFKTHTVWLETSPLSTDKFPTIQAPSLSLSSISQTPALNTPPSSDIKRLHDATAPHPALNKPSSKSYVELNSRWFAKQGSKEKAGSLLLTYRLRSGLSQGALSKCTGLTQSSISDYEAGYKPIPPRLVQRFSMALGLSEEETRELEKHANNYFAARDLPIRKQAGALLQGYRMRQNIMQQMLADALGIPSSKLSYMERGTRPISPEIAKEIVDRLQLSDEEATRFKELAKLSNTGIYQRTSDNGDWIADRPVTKQGGLLLKHFRMRANIMQKALADELHITHYVLSRLERGMHPISAEIVQATQKALRLSDEEAQKLEDYAAPLRNKKDATAFRRMMVSVGGAAPMNQSPLATDLSENSSGHRRK